MFKSIGHAAYGLAAKTGLAAGTEQPPYPCAVPLRTLEDPADVDGIQSLADEVYVAARDMLGRDNMYWRDMLESGDYARHDPRKPIVPRSAENPWHQVDYRDPDKNGDFVLMTKPHIGPFNFAKATMTFRGCTPERIMDTMLGEDFNERKKFSADLAKFEILARPTPNSNIQYHEYHAPPPVSSRHLIYLFERRYVPEEDTFYVYGCSIDYPPYNKHIGKNTIRAICLWCWALTPYGTDTLATYASCMNPNGWAPTFIIGFMKGEIGRELISIRRVMYGEEKALVKENANAAKKQRDSDSPLIATGSTFTSEAPFSGNPAARRRRGSHVSSTAGGSRENSRGMATGEGYARMVRAVNGGNGLTGSFFGGLTTRTDTITSDMVQWDEENPQQEEEMAWRELEENEELMLF